MTQMSVEYLLRLLGDHRDKQWYQLLPERYQKEKILMQERYPAFQLCISENGDIYWEGEISVSTNIGNIEADYNPLHVKIKCKRDYPLSFPVIIDVNNILTNGRCPHIDKKNGSLCYAFRPTTELNFIEKNFVVDVMPVIQTFLLKQFCYEQKGVWPSAEEHGTKAFIIYEYEQGCYNINELCPCVETSKSYKDCHLPSVERTIAKIEDDLRRSYDLIEIGRNYKCPCGSGKKYKKCCDITGKFGSMRQHHLQKYKGLTKDHLRKLLSRHSLN